MHIPHATTTHTCARTCTRAHHIAHSTLQAAHNPCGHVLTHLHHCGPRMCADTSRCAGAAPNRTLVRVDGAAVVNAHHARSLAAARQARSPPQIDCTTSRVTPTGRAQQKEEEQHYQAPRHTTTPRAAAASPAAAYVCAVAARCVVSGGWAGHTHTTDCEDRSRESKHKLGQHL